MQCKIVQRGSNNFENSSCVYFSSNSVQQRFIRNVGEVFFFEYRAGTAFYYFIRINFLKQTITLYKVTTAYIKILSSILDHSTEFGHLKLNKISTVLIILAVTFQRIYIFYSFTNVEKVLNNFWKGHASIIYFLNVTFETHTDRISH